jgi:hypothetical protein
MIYNQTKSYLHFQKTSEKAVGMFETTQKLYHFEIKNVTILNN